MTLLLVMLQHGARRNFLFAALVAAGFLGLFLYMLIHSLLFRADAANVFALWHGTAPLLWSLAIAKMSNRRCGARCGSHRAHPASISWPVCERWSSTRAMISSRIP